MSSASSHWWVDEDICTQFQIDLSCLVDGELAGPSAGRAITHLEDCSVCNAFFEDIRRQLKAHRELSDPDGLIERYSMLVGSSTSEDLETIELVHRLSTIFYQLGKAYVLLAVDPDFRTRVFEKAVSVEPTRTFGRGFVDGVLASGREDAGGFDWRGARHMLNGQLSKIDSAKEKGRRLLQEALAVDPAHEEARFYLAYIDESEGKSIRAAQAYRQLFQTAVYTPNRGHAAVHLGNLYSSQKEFKKAIACCRWVLSAGLADEEDGFFVVRFNLAMYYAHLRQEERSLGYFREALDRHPNHVQDLVRLFQNAPRLHAVIEQQTGFAEALVRECPEFFRSFGDVSDSENVQ